MNISPTPFSNTFQITVFLRTSFFAAVFLSIVGCASEGSGIRRDWATEAVRFQIPETELVAIIQQVQERHKLTVLWLDKTVSDTIHIYLADKPERAHGIVVVFRKIDGQWREDPKSQDEWII